jgi:hypothetical protein
VLHYQKVALTNKTFVMGLAFSDDIKLENSCFVATLFIP